MKNNSQDLNVLEPVTVEPYIIEQVMAGLEMGAMDEPLLKYMEFLSGLLPVESAYFLHVVPRFDLYRFRFEKELQSVAAQLELKENLVNQMANSINSNLSKRKGIDIEYDIREGDPLEEILKDAEEVSADLVVIGQKNQVKTHGILAKKLSRNVKCNALIVPENSKHSLKKILVPIDFSEYSVKALRIAIAINKQLKEPAEITCLNIYELPDFASFNISRTRENFGQMMKEDRMEAMQSFCKTYFPDEHQNIQKVVLQKETTWTPHYLMDYAQENETDFVVMGAKGHSKVALLMMGSVTEKFLSINESIPTLVVK